MTVDMSKHHGNGTARSSFRVKRKNSEEPTERTGVTKRQRLGEGLLAGSPIQKQPRVRIRVGGCAVSVSSDDSVTSIPCKLPAARSALTATNGRAFPMVKSQQSYGSDEGEPVRRSPRDRNRDDRHGSLRFAKLEELRNYESVPDDDLRPNHNLGRNVKERLEAEARERSYYEIRSDDSCEPLKRTPRNRAQRIFLSSPSDEGELSGNEARTGCEIQASALQQDEVGVEGMLDVETRGDDREDRTQHCSDEDVADLAARSELDSTSGDDKSVDDGIVPDTDNDIDQNDADSDEDDLNVWDHIKPFLTDDFIYPAAPLDLYLLSCDRQREIPEAWKDKVRGLGPKVAGSQAFTALLIYLTGVQGACSQCSIRSRQLPLPICVGLPLAIPEGLRRQMDSMQCCNCECVRAGNSPPCVFMSCNAEHHADDWAVAAYAARRARRVRRFKNEAESTRLSRAALRSPPEETDDEVEDTTASPGSRTTDSVSFERQARPRVPNAGTRFGALPFSGKETPVPLPHLNPSQAQKSSSGDAGSQANSPQHLEPVDAVSARPRFIALDPDPWTAPAGSGGPHQSEAWELAPGKIMRDVGRASKCEYPIESPSRCGLQSDTKSC